MAVVVSSTVAGAVGAAPAGVDGTHANDVVEQPIEGEPPELGVPDDRSVPEPLAGSGPTPAEAGGGSRLGFGGGDRFLGVAPTNGTEVHNVTLITGQTVTVVESGNTTSYRVQADAKMRRISTPSGTYVYPAGVNFSRYDVALFNVDLLIEQGVADGDRGTIPVIVRYDTDAVAGTGPDDLGRLAGRLTGFEHRRTLSSIDAAAGIVDKSAAGDLALAASPAIERIRYDRRVSVDLDESTGMISAPAARERYGVDGSGVRVAIVDSGVDASHPDLDEGTVVAAKDFTGEGNASDALGHGTHVAGIVTGDGDANGDYVGVAPDAQILNARVLDDWGGGRESGIVDGIEWSVENDADVISMSLGVRTDGDSDPMTEAVDWARSRGVAVVVSAGNSGPERGTIGSPAISDAAITVGAADEDGDEVVDFSSRGPSDGPAALKPDVVAPGTEVASACVPGSTIGCSEELEGPYISANGTSMSAPHVTGAIALLLDEHPDWGPQRIENALETTADPLPGEDETAAFTQGAGMINASAALGTDVVVSNATMSIEATGAVQTRTLTVTNRGEDPTELTADLAVTNRQTGEARPELASINRTAVELAPGESADIRLDVDTGVSPGIYAGRLTLTESTGGQTYGAVFGLANSAELTIEKDPMGGTSAADDRVAVLSYDEFTDDGSSFGSVQVYSLDEDGETTVETFGDRFLVWSFGENEKTNTTVLTYDRVTVREDERLVLDEATTASYSLDTSQLDDRYDGFEALTVSPTVQLAVDASECGDEVDPRYCTVEVDPGVGGATSTRVRVTPSPDTNVSVEYLLVPERHHVPGDRYEYEVDSPVVYHLLHSTVGVEGDRTYRPDGDSLASRTYEFYGSRSRSPGDPGSDYEHYSYATTTKWADLSGTVRRFTVGNRSNQTVYYSPGARYETEFETVDYGHSYEKGPAVYDAGDARTVAVNRHPLVFQLNAESEYGTSFSWYPHDSGPAPLDFYSFAGWENATYRVRESGELVDTRRGYEHYLGYLSGETYNVTANTTLPSQQFSTRLYGSFVGIGRSEGDGVPPSVRSVRVRNITRNNHVAGGNATVVVNLTDEGSSVREVALWFAPGSVDSRPPWGDGLGFEVDEDCDAGAEDGWRRVCLTRVGDDRYRGTVPLSGSADTVHLGGVADDGRGNVVRWATYEAFGVVAANDPPTARTLGDRTVLAGGDVELDARDSDDRNGDRLDYEWEQVGGPDVSLTDAGTATPEFSAPSADEPRTYVFRVTVDDGFATDTDTVSVTVVPDDGDEVDRSLSTAEVPAGGSAGATLTVEFEVARDRASIIDGFEGPIADSTIESVTIDGRVYPEDRRVLTNSDSGGVTVALREVPPDSTVQVEYRVDLSDAAAPGDTVRFTGSPDNPDVSTGLRTEEFGTVNATVVEDPVERADGDGDGDIDDAELRAAIVGWSSGEYTDDGLRAIIVAWSS